MPGRKKSSTSLAPKCDPADVAQVVQWLLDGQSEYDIIEAINTNKLGNAEALKNAAAEKLKELGQFDPAIVTGFCFAAYRDLYRRMIEIADFAGALRAVKLIEELARKQK